MQTSEEQSLLNNRFMDDKVSYVPLTKGEF